MAEDSREKGTKRPHSSTSESTSTGPVKKRRIHHALRHVQQIPKDIEPAPQDPIFAQGQLLKSISAALVMAGYDSVLPTALEMFRSHVEEYMLKFLAYTRTSMHNNRRTTPTALDFASSLANMPSSHLPQLLLPQLALDVPEDISYPSIPEPEPAPAPTNDFSKLLEPLIEHSPPAWVPRHFPQLPPKHAWKETPVFPEREKDSRKLREKATEEGVLAEQALRKLAAAAKTSAINAEKHRNNALRGEGKARDPARSGGRAGVRVHEDTFAEMLKDVGGGDEATELASDEAEVSSSRPKASYLSELEPTKATSSETDVPKHIHTFQRYLLTYTSADEDWGRSEYARRCSGQSRNVALEAARPEAWHASIGARGSLQASASSHIK